MSWYRAHSQSALLVGLTVAVPLVLFLYVLGSFWGQRSGYQQEIERLEPRIARLSGLALSEQTLRESAGQVDSRVLDLVYPQTEERSAVAAALQKEVRKLLIDAGLDVKNSQVLAAREIDGLDYLTVKLRVGGDLAELDTALGQIGAYLPLLLVESIDITPVRQSRRRTSTAGKQSLTANLQLLSLRAGSENGV